MVRDVMASLDHKLVALDGTKDPSIIPVKTCLFLHCECDVSIYFLLPPGQYGGPPQGMPGYMQGGMPPYGQGPPMGYQGGPPMGMRPPVMSPAGRY